MQGFTFVLIDSEEPSEGDFVYVEAFENLQDLAAVEEDGSYPGWVDRIIQQAQNICEAREEK